jgi:xylulokinase
VLLPKDYVRLRLTGEYATDASDAAGTLLLDAKERDWSAEILAALEIPAEWMPAVFEGPERTGELGRSVAGELGLPPGVPVSAGGGDNAAAAVGVGVIDAGLLSSSIGTSGVLFAPADEFAPDPSGRIHACLPRRPRRVPPDGRYSLRGRLPAVVA